MQASTTLRLSIGLNLALSGLVVALLWRTSPPSSEPAAAAPPAADAPRPQVASAAPTDPSPPGPSTDAPFPRSAVAALEQMGVARDVIVNVLLGDFHRRWDIRFAGLEARYAPRRVPEREYIELARLRDAAQVRALKEAFGEDGYAAWDQEHTLRMLNTGGIRLSPAEAARAYRLQKEFDEQYRELQMAMEDGVADAADAAGLHARAQQALDAQLEQLLGKPRFDAMRGVADPISDVYRQYGDLNPTPAQAQAVLQADARHREREAALVARLRESPAEAARAGEELQATQAARETELRRIFGAEAYDAMRRQNDPTYRRLEQFAQTWEIQDHEIHAVYETVRTFHDQAELIRAAAALRESAGHAVNWPEVNAAVEQARQQTEAGLLQLVGSSRLWRLKENGVLTMR